MKKTDASHNALIIVFITLCVAFVAVSIILFVLFVKYLNMEHRSAAIYEELGEIATSTQDTDVDELTRIMTAVNPDYVCWLTVGGTDINYPVARAINNEKYLGLSFTGEQNPLGAIFVDYRCPADLNAPHIIIYGHNAKNRTMFGSLRGLQDDNYLAKHPYVTLILDGQRLDYRIFSVRKTDINDPAYQLTFEDAADLSRFLENNGAPANTAQVLTLSTCVSGSNDDERVILQAALE